MEKNPLKVIVFKTKELNQMASFFKKLGENPTLKEICSDSNYIYRYQSGVTG